MLDIKELKKLYYSDKANCCKCGCTLEDGTGNGLGAAFVLDKEGKFYCINCDKEFEDGDERIYEADLDDDILEFGSDEEAIAWGQTQNASKYSFINCKIKGEDVILCQTNLVYEDEIWNAAYNAFRYLFSLLPQKTSEDDGVDEASEIRDKILELFQKNYNVRILEVFDEF